MSRLVRTLRTVDDIFKTVFLAVTSVLFCVYITVFTYALYH